jgi:hypothetical protein
MGIHTPAVADHKKDGFARLVHGREGIGHSRGPAAGDKVFYKFIFPADFINAFFRPIFLAAIWQKAC